MQLLKFWRLRTNGDAAHDLADRLRGSMLNAVARAFATSGRLGGGVSPKSAGGGAEHSNSSFNRGSAMGFSSRDRASPARVPGSDSSAGEERAHASLLDDDRTTAATSRGNNSHAY